MQIGVVTVDGRQVGVIAFSVGVAEDTLTPDLGSLPEGRAADGDLGYHRPHHYVGHGHSANIADRAYNHTGHDISAPSYHRGHDDAVGRGVAAREQDGSGPPSSILDRARQVALHGGAGAVQRFMAENGYPRDGNWCGEFAASVVHAAGGTPPRGAPVASNWRRWGAPVDTPQPGDIAIRRGVPTGSTGSHVTIVESVDPRSGHFVGLGGNQGAWERRFPTGGYDFRRGASPEVDRARHRATNDGGEINFNPETMAP